MFETTLRYNSLNNKHAVESVPPRFDSLLIDAKMLAYSKKALPQFIHNLRTERSIDYYIDPIISDFRAGSDFRYSDGTLRGWYDTYVDNLGDPLQEVLRRDTIANPRHMEEETIAEISRSVVLFQEEFVANKVEEYAGKYVDVSRDEVRPKAIIPWHHRINETEDLGPNRTILDTSIAESTITVKPCIHTTKNFIRDTVNRSGLVEMISDYDVSECFLLVEELGKHETDEGSLKNTIDLVYDLSQAEIRPHFFNGDYFSNLLAYFGLAGTAYGVMYGEEYRERLEYNKQDGMLLRYYVDEVKDFLKVPAAVELMQDTDTPMCSCSVCQRHYDEWADIIALQESEDNLMNPLQKHYVECRWRHARQVEEESFEEVIEKLKSDFHEYVEAYSTARQISPDKDFDYLQRWINAVESRSELASERATDAITTV